MRTIRGNAKIKVMRPFQNGLSRRGSLGTTAANYDSLKPFIKETFSLYKKYPIKETAYLKTRWLSYNYFIESSFKKLKASFDIKNPDRVKSFLRKRVNFFEHLARIRKYSYDLFAIEGKPLLKASLDPEFGGEIFLVIVVNVVNKADEDINKLFELRERSRKRLKADEENSISIFLR